MDDNNMLIEHSNNNKKCENNEVIKLIIKVV